MTKSDGMEAGKEFGRTTASETRTATNGGSAAPGAAVEHENAPIDSDLQSIIERWDGLADAVKTGIMAMIQASCG